MIKKQRMSKAGEADVRMLSEKASEYKSAMEMAYSQGLWDPAMSNGVHALLLMANAVTAQVRREYFTGQDHDRAAGYLLEVAGPDAKNAVQATPKRSIMPVIATMHPQVSQSGH